MFRVAADRLEAFLAAAFRAGGFSPFSAETAAEGLALASLRRVDSHAIRLMPHYLAAAKAGRINRFNPLSR